MASVNAREETVGYRFSAEASTARMASSACGGAPHKLVLSRRSMAQVVASGAYTGTPRNEGRSRSPFVIARPPAIGGPTRHAPEVLRRRQRRRHRRRGAK